VSVINAHDMWEVSMEGFHEHKKGIVGMKEEIK
jgi:hypothetical protein